MRRPTEYPNFVKLQASLDCQEFVPFRIHSLYLLEHRLNKVFLKFVVLKMRMLAYWLTRH